MVHHFSPRIFKKKVHYNTRNYDLDFISNVSNHNFQTIFFHIFKSFISLSFYSFIFLVIYFPGNSFLCLSASTFIKHQWWKFNLHNWKISHFKVIFTEIVSSRNWPRNYITAVVNMCELSSDLLATKKPREKCADRIEGSM